MDMLAEKTVNPFNNLREMITNEIVSKAIYVAAKLNIADHLSNGPKSYNELAKITSSDSNKLYRVLRVLSSKGIFYESLEGQFELTEKGELLKQGRKTLHSFALMFGEMWNQKPFSGLLNSVKTGESAFTSTMGMGLFEYLDSEKESADLFNDVMTDFLGSVHQAVVDAYDFSSCEKIIDVGGGHGSLMKLILDKHPNIKGVIFDTEKVIEGSKSNIGKFGLENRCTAIAGDFFKEVNVSGDLYILSRVIHDWNDDECIKILSNCRNKMSDDSRLILVEQIMLKDNNPSFTKITDLWMMMMLDEGRERTSDEFDSLFEKSGLKISNIIKTNVNDCVIELQAK